MQRLVVKLLLIILCSSCLAVSPTVKSFNTGQVSPLMETRTDFQKYQSSNRTVENMLVTVHGPAQRRPGTKFIAETKDSSSVSRLIPFEASTDDAYPIELGNIYARFYRAGGQVLTSGGTEDLTALDNIIAHWLINDNAANTQVLDDDGATHNGVASINTDVIHEDGKVGTGSFDLAAQYAVSVADSADFTFVEGVDGDFSLTGWVYIKDTETEQVIISKWDETAGSTAREWKLLLDEDLKLKMVLADESLFLDQDLVAQWKMNDSLATDVVLDALAANNGALTDGGDNFTSDHSVPGITNNALSFDGTNDIVTVPDAAAFSFSSGGGTDTAFSISAWVNMTDATSFAIINKRVNSVSQGEWMLTTGADDKLYFNCTLDDYTNRIGRGYNTALGEGSWIHVVATYDATKASSGIILYVNGSAVDDIDDNAGSYTGMVAGSSDVRIGRDVTTGYSEGKIDNVIIFNKKLSSGDVTLLYNGGAGTESLDNGSISALSDDALTAGWRYVAMTYNGQNNGGAAAADDMILYVDSVVVSSTATNLSTYSKMEDTAAVVRIGSQESSAGAIEKIWAERLDEFAVFGDVLTPTEVASLFSDTSIYEIITPFSSEEISEIQYAQSDDAMYIVNGTDVPQVLIRIEHDEWTIADGVFETGPFQTENTDLSLTITPSATTGSVTLTASSLLFEVGHVGSIWEISQPRDTSVFTGSVTDGALTGASTAFFNGGYSFTTDGTWDATVTLQRSTDVGVTWENALSPLNSTNFDNPAETEETGAIYRVLMSDWVSGTANWTFIISDSLNRGIVRITGFTSSTVTTATVITDLANTDATSKWREGYWSDFRGWPKTIAFHQQRLVFGGSRSFPQVLWFGKQDPDDYTNFNEGTLDTSSFTAALEGQNPIRWLLSQEYLTIGSSGSCGLWGERGVNVTPTSPAYQDQTSHGSASISAVMGGDSIIYIERGARNARELSFSLQVDKYLSPNLSVLSPEITESGMKEIAFQLRPSPILWCVLNNGDMATLTYQSDQAVVAWSKQVTDGNFESVTSVPSITGSEDEVWVIVQRTFSGVNSGNPVRYVEQFQPRDWGTDDNDAWFLDSALSYNSTPQTSFTGLGHLEGETMSIYADRLIENPEIVVSGSITIDNAASRVLAGLPFTSKLETFPIVIDPQDAAFNKKIKFVWADLFESGALEYGGSSAATLMTVNFENSLINNPAATAQDLYTSAVSQKKLMWFFGSLKKQTIYLETSEPMPLTVRGLTPDYDLTGN